MPSLPSSFTFRVGQQEQITWFLTDANNAPVSGVSVSASLYLDRNIRNAQTTPGSLDPIFQNINLPESVTLGTYVGQVPSTFNPISATVGYVVVVRAAGGPLANPITWQIPGIVIFPENVVDLITLDQVKAFAGMQSANTDDDALIQLLISGFSLYVMNKTQRTSYRQVGNFAETYDGNGNQRLFLRESPIVTLSSIQIGLYNSPISTSFGVPGIFVEDSRRSIAFRTSYGTFRPPQGIYPYGFTPGQGNILVTYSAGYSSVPFDLQEACMRAVTINYKRKDWLDLASKTLSAGSGVSGTISYRNWMLPPEVIEVIMNYKRWAVV